MTRQYGKLPREVWPLLVDWYDALNDMKTVRGSPYKILADMLGISRQRVQQVVLDERKRRAREAQHPIAKSVE